MNQDAMQTRVGETIWRAVGLDRRRRPDSVRNALKRVGLPGVLVAALVLLGCAKHQETGRPETLILSGWNNYRLGEFSLATRDFEAAMKKAPQGGPEHLGALYGLATTWNLRRPGEDPDRAAQLFRQVIALAPTNDLAAWSWLALARMKAMPVAGESPELNAQVLAYQDVIDRFPFHSAGEEAFLFQQAARLETPDVDLTREVLAALERFIEIHPKSPWLSSAYGLVAHCCTVLNLPDKRFAAMLKASKAAEIDPLNPLQDLSAIYWQLATVAEFDLGDFALAREYYRRLIAEYPKEQRVFLAKQELRRMDEVEEEIRGTEKEESTPNIQHPTPNVQRTERRKESGVTGQ